MLTPKTSLGRLTTQLDRLIKTTTTKTAFLFDVDECLTAGHLTKQVNIEAGLLDKIENIIKSADKGEEFDFDLLYEINAAYNSCNQQDFLNHCKSAADIIPWIDYVHEAMKDLNHKGDIFFISSGMYYPILEKARLLPATINVLAVTMDFNKKSNADTNICGYPNMIVTSELKGYIATYLKQNGFKVLAVGHDGNDRYMLEAADIGLLLNPSKVMETSQFTKIKNLLDVKNFIPQLLHPEN